MYKFADRHLDISNDIGYNKLSKLMKKSSYKEDFKSIDVLEPEDLELLPDNDFALIHVDKDNSITRRFPCPDVDNAIVSALYLDDTHGEMNAEEAAIAANNLLRVLDSKAGDNSVYPRESVYKLMNKLEHILDLYPAAQKMENIYRVPKKSDEELRTGLDKKASAIKIARSSYSDNDFVFVNKVNGVTHRLFPIKTKEELVKQASYFDANFNKFSMEHRNMFAMKLRDKAAELKVKLPATTISKYASYQWCPTAYECLKNRIDQLKQCNIVFNEKTAEYELHTRGNSDRDKALVGYVKLSSLIEKMDIDKYAEALRLLDKASGLDKGYGKYIRDPYASTYKQTAFTDLKPADLSAMGKDLASQSTKFMDVMIKAKDILNLDLSELGGMIDQFTFNELKADPISVFNSLPIPYKSVIVEAIQNKN